MVVLALMDCNFIDIMIRRRSLRNSVSSLNGSQDSLGSWSGLKRHSSFDFAESKEDSVCAGSNESLECLSEPASASVVMRLGLVAHTV